MPCQGRRKQDPPDLKGSPCLPLPTLPAAQLQVKTRMLAPKRRMGAQIGIITEITAKVTVACYVQLPNPTDAASSV